MRFALPTIRHRLIRAGAVCAAALVPLAAPASTTAGTAAQTPIGGVAPANASVVRLSGADRFATAAAVSSANFAPGVAIAFVANGANFPDALAGGPAAAALAGPILLVRSDAVPDATAAELARLHPGRIVALGGPAAVADATLGALRSFTSGAVTRIAGSDRYATAAAISAAAFSPGVPVAYLADGENFPDALAAGPAAGSAHGPVLLTSPGSLPAATAAELARLHPAKVIISGGSSAVSDAVSAEAAGDGPVTRLAGGDRYSTGLAVIANRWSAASTVYVASGTSFPDALAASAVAGAANDPLVLVPGDNVPDSVMAALRGLGAANIVVLGGPAAVSDPVASYLGGGPWPGAAGAPPNSTAYEMVSPDGTPVRWNPCAAIHYIVNTANMPADGMNDLQTGLAMVSAATGISFVSEGTTSEVPTATRDGFQPAVYGQRWAPVLIGWQNSLSGGFNLSGREIGISKWQGAYTTSSPDAELVSGEVVLLTPNFSAGLPSGFATMASRGTLMLHELGHVMGLNHPADMHQVMSASVPNDMGGVPAAYQAGDLAGLHALGASGGCLPSVPPQHTR